MTGAIQSSRPSLQRRLQRANKSTFAEGHGPWARPDQDELCRHNETSLKYDSTAFTEDRISFAIRCIREQRQSLLATGECTLPVGGVERGVLAPSTSHRYLEALIKTQAPLVPSFSRALEDCARLRAAHTPLSARRRQEEMAASC